MTDTEAPANEHQADKPPVVAVPRPVLRAPNKRRHQATDSPKVIERLNEIIRISLDGATSIDIHEYVREQEAAEGSIWQSEFPLSKSQINRYVKRAWEAIHETAEVSRKRLFRRHLAQRRALYAKAVGQGDTRAALACLDSECLLLGLFPEKRQKISTTVKVAGGISVEHRDSLDPADLRAAAALIGLATRGQLAVAHRDLQEDGGPQPVDSLGATQSATPVLAIG